MPRYSHRLSWSTPANQFAHSLAAARAQNREILDLTLSNPTQAFAAEYPHGEISAALASAPNYTYQPDPCGLPAARQAIAHYYASHSIALDPAQILLTASTSEAYALLFKLLCDPSDQVLIPTPSYPLFEHLAALEAVTTIPYHLRYDGAWHVDFADLRQRITAQSRAIVIVNPNNPTGTFLTLAERDQLFEIARQHSLPVISDEVFLDYPLQPRHSLARTLIGSDGPLTFSLNGLSKAAAMPQMKLAWIVVNGPASDRHIACERLAWISDTYLSVGTPVQAALATLLSVGQAFAAAIRDRLLRNLRTLDRLLQDTAAHRLHLDAGWSVIVKLPAILPEEHWVESLLQEKSVLVQPGYFFDLPSPPHIVLSLLTEPQQFETAVERIVAHVQAIATQA